ncbi:MAG: acetolactate synthase small subunit [Halobacteriaceae archaeon]
MAGGLEGPAPHERPHPQGRRNTHGIRIDPEAEATEEPRRTVLSALVQHEPGVLAEVSGLFSRRRFNIESLTVGPTLDDDWARITMVIEEPEPGIEQAEKQLEKLIPVVSVTELGADSVAQELAMFKLGADDPDEVQAITEMHDGKVVHVDRDSITVEVTGTETVIDEALDSFERFTVREIVRTGTAALRRGAALTAEETAEETP